MSREHQEGAAVIRPVALLLGTGLVVALMAAPVFGLALWSESNVVQPISFSHKKHAGELGFSCMVCHRSVESQTFAGLPGPDTCMACHQAKIRSATRKHLALNPELVKLKDYAALGSIPWKRLYLQPGYVFFSHRRHVAVAKIDCKNCHGDMPAQAIPPPAPLVDQTMKWCTDCHQQRHASLDCDACHK